MENIKTPAGIIEKSGTSFFSMGRYLKSQNITADYAGNMVLLIKYKGKKYGYTSANNVSEVTKDDLIINGTYVLGLMQ